MIQALGVFGWLDYTMLQTTLAWRMFRDLWNINFINFKTFLGHSKLHIIIISIQPLGQFLQEPEPSQASMALARCILGKFLGVVCHCFSQPLDIPTFAARCLHIPINACAPSSERWNCLWARMVR
jgi:hypothetical protein